MTTSVLPAQGLIDDLAALGISPQRQVYANLSTPALYEESLRRRETRLAAGGPIVATTGPQTGRSPQDKYIVRTAASEDAIWWGPVNREMTPEAYAAIRRDVASYLGERDLFVLDAIACADPANRLPIRLLTPSAWHALFARTMFLPPIHERHASDHQPPFTILHAPELALDAARHGTRSEIVIAVDLDAREVIIAGTRYAGEIKKSVFTVLNYLLPEVGVLPMHCSANQGAAGDVALFFGLSGTGKTTLSADPTRILIGDDEHGWSDDGVFNFEGGCYAKVIRLNPAAEPEIFATTRMFGTVLENVVLDERTGTLDLDSDALTENTRAAYSLSAIPNASPTGTGGHPETIFMLTADAFGVLPPLARLTPGQAMYHFLSGYTARLAGTERGVTEPTATFSACFGAPFLPLPPAVYAAMLGERIAQHGSRVWLVNTGWTGGAYGTGSRMPIAATRAMIRAVLAGELDDIETRPDPVFGLHVPVSVPGVDPAILDPGGTWSSRDAWTQAASRLAGMFRENFERFAAGASPAIREAGPTGG